MSIDSPPYPGSIPGETTVWVSKYSILASDDLVPCGSQRLVPNRPPVSSTERA